MRLSSHKTIFKDCLDIDINCIFHSHKIGSHFSLKHKTPLSLLSNVVYHFKCLRDVNLSYIGKTKRHLVTRAKEHASGESAISEHLLTCDTCNNNFDVDRFRVLDNGKNDFECLIKEALLIKKFRPKLNNHTFIGKSFQLRVFN